MSVKLVTVDNDTVELKDNKVVGKDSSLMVWMSKQMQIL